MRSQLQLKPANTTPCNGTSIALSLFMNPIELEISDVESKIYIIREKKVMLDFDLAILYEVPTKRLNQQVQRNPKRFPPDFMFTLRSRGY